MGLFDKMKDAFTPKDNPAADQAAAPAQSAEDAERAAAQARIEADERAVNEATQRADAEARLRADEQAVADAQKQADEKAAAEAAAAQEAEAKRAEEQAAQARAEEERRNAEAAEANRRAEEERQRAEEASRRPGISTRRVIDVVNHDSDPNTPTGQGMDPDLGRLLEGALRKALADNNLPNANKDDGALGTSFLEAYSVWQGHLGYDGDDANGVPGRSSLEKLAEATGMFTVGD